MKKIIIALLCAFTLFAFASCSGDTPAPDTGTDTARWDTVPEELRGTWEYSLGEGYTSSSTPARMLGGSTSDRISIWE